MNRLLLVLCLSVFTTAIAWRIVDPILPVLAADLNVSLSEVVLLTTAYSVPFAAMQLMLGPVGDAWGKVRVIRLSLVIVAASLVLMAVSPDYVTVLLTRVLGGAFTGGVNSVSLALIGERIPYQQRQVALGRFTSAMIAGQITGAAVSGFVVGLIGWITLFALVATIVTTAALMVHAMLDDSKHRRTRFTVRGAFTNYRSVLGTRDAWPVLASLFFEGVFILALIPFVAGMVLQHQAEGSAPAGIVIGAFALGGTAFGFMVRGILTTIGPRNMIRLGGVLAGVSFIATALPLHWWVIACLFFIVGFGFYMFHSNIQLQATELAPHARGAGVSLGACFFHSGQGFGPIFWAPFAEHRGFPIVFFSAGVLTILLGFIVAWRMRLKERMPGAA